MEGERECANCSHDRCSDCEREPPKRVRPPPSIEVVSSVQEELAAAVEPSERHEVAAIPAVATSSSAAQPGTEGVIDTSGRPV